MMPKMNGLEAVKLIRDMDYDNPILALTANAVTGSKEMFIKNGFDGYISKPIDIREMNSWLNRLVRDKQLPEVVEEARKLMLRENAVSEPAKDLTPDSNLAAAVAQDIQTTMYIVEDALLSINSTGKTDLTLFTTTVHGMKSALLNIGEAKLSNTALLLEKAGGSGNLSVISAETPAFISALRAFIEKLDSQKTDHADGISDGDALFLEEKLDAVKAACERYDPETAAMALDELKLKKWPRETNALLDAISVSLLRGELKKVVAAVTKSP
jgi:CheY-like chemotaxis protein